MEPIALRPIVAVHAGEESARPERYAGCPAATLFARPPPSQSDTD